MAKADWIKDHEAAATDYVEMMLDMMRQWQAHGNTWVTPAEAIFKNSGVSGAQLHSAWRAFQSGGYFSVNGGVNLAGTQKIMDLFFKLRDESPNKYLSKASDVYDTGPLEKALAKMGIAKGAPGLPDIPDWYKSTAGHKG